MTPARLLATVALLVCAAGPGRAQPTYKLDVKPNLKPRATLRLDGGRLSRSAVEDDPGFRLQYHVRKDGKTVATAEARAAATFDLPRAEAGTYSVVLELFYPAYKGGTQQKGEFKPVSNVLTYKVEAGQVTLVDTPPPPPAAKPAK